MAKLTLNNVTNFADNSTAVTITAANNDAIEAAIENTLSRNGTSPNAMEADLDMNSNRILNLPAPVNATEPVTKAYGDEYYGNPKEGAENAQAAAEAARDAALDAQAAAELAKTNAELAEANAETAEAAAELAADRAENLSLVQPKLSNFYATGVYNGFPATVNLQPKPEVAPSLGTFVRATNAYRVNSKRLLESVAPNVIRHQYSPETGEYLGLLIEAGATNGITRSAEFDNAAWTKSFVTITANDAVAPTGATVADRWVPTTDNAGHNIRNTTTDVAPDVQQAASVFIKSTNGEYVWARITVFDNSATSNFFRATFNISTQVVSNGVAGGNGTYTRAYIEPHFDGWYRLVVVGTPNTSGTTTRMTIEMLGTSGEATFAGTGSSAGWWIWGAQLEAGAYASSYISTTTEAATRDPDDWTIATSGIGFNTRDATLIAKFRTGYNVGSRGIAQIDDGSNSNCLRIVTINSGGELGAYAIEGGAVLGSFTNDRYFLAANTEYTVAVSVGEDGMSGIVNGESPDTDADVLDMSVMTTIRIGRFFTSSSHLNGTIKLLAYFPVKLTDDLVQEFTESLMYGSSSSFFDNRYIQTFDADMLGRAAAVRANGPAGLAGLLWKYSHIAEHGQSLSNGGIGHPNKTLTPHPYNVMVGESVRPSSGIVSTFNQYGTLQFNALVSTVDDLDTGTQYDEAGIAGLSDTAGVEGETMSIALANQLKRDTDFIRGYAGDSTRVFAVTSSGLGGTNIADLTDTTDVHYQRLLDAAQKVKDLADAASSTSGLAILKWEQGQADYSPVTPKADYKTSLTTFIDNVYDDVAVGIFGQTHRPLTIITQTGDDWTNDYTGYDGYGMTVARAQLEVALERDDVVLSGPTYQVVNKPGDHLDGNGYRWIGCQDAKVAHRVLNLGQGWQPLRPLRAVYSGNQVLVGFHVPAPPIQFQNFYDEYVSTDLPQKGLRVTDGSGDNKITGVEIVGQATILITCEREITSTSKLWTADKTVNGGRTNICDSDTYDYLYTYDYDAARGDMAASNIAALVGKKYPAWNWCIADNFDIEPAS